MLSVQPICLFEAVIFAVPTSKHVQLKQAGFHTHTFKQAVPTSKYIQLKQAVFHTHTFKHAISVQVQNICQSALKLMPRERQKAVISEVLSFKQTRRRFPCFI